MRLVLGDESQGRPVSPMTTPQCPRNLGRGPYTGTRLRVRTKLTNSAPSLTLRSRNSFSSSLSGSCMPSSHSVPLSVSRSLFCLPLSSSTLGAHAHRWFCPSVRLSVNYRFFSATMRNKHVKIETNGFSATLALMTIFVKVPRSEVMALIAQTYLDRVRLFCGCRRHQ